MINNKAFNVENILDKLEEFNKFKLDFITVHANTSLTKAEGILFLKPEICNIENSKLSLILQQLECMATLYKIEFLSIHIVSGPYLIKRKIFEKNYRAIKKYSKIKNNKDEKIHPLLRSYLEKYNCEDVVGSIDLINLGYSADFIIDLWKNYDPAVKVDQDLYIVPCQIKNKRYLLINGFFPYQMEKYKEINSKIILFTFTTSTSFERLKSHFQGSIDVNICHKESFRQFLCEFMEKYHLDKMTPSQNGIHVSESKTDGLKEIQVFFGSLRGNNLCLPM